MDREGKSLRMVASFLLGVGVTLTLMAFHHTTNLYDETLVKKFSIHNGTALNVTVAHHEADDPDKELVEILKKAANQDNTVILTIINEAFAAPESLLDIFLESFRAGENIEHFLNNLVLVAMDEVAYDRCKLLHPYCHFLRIEGVDYKNEERYMSKNYVKMGWDRNMFQLKILKLGFNFLFTDVDIIWLRDPFKYISVAAHIAIACDRFYGDDQYNLNSSDINTGFLFAKSCNKTIEFYKIWLDEGPARFKYSFEQVALNQMKAELVSRTEAQLQLLDTTYIGNFCQLKNDMSKMCTLHVACCVGLKNKYHDLKVAFEDWKNFTAKSVDERRSGKFHWTGPKKCPRR